MDKRREKPKRLVLLSERQYNRDVEVIAGKSLTPALKGGEPPTTVKLAKSSYQPTKAKNPRGRPAEKVMPDPIRDTAENIARACMMGPPKKGWNYLRPGSKAKKW